MFIGHFGVALAATRIAPRTPLTMLIVAAQFADILWPALVLIGIEVVAIRPGVTRVTPLDFVSYPISHSLVALAGWATLIAAAYWSVGRDIAGAIAVWLLVLSHWVLDFISHRPDMPILPGGPRVGLGLWNSLAGTLVVETGLFAAGVALYLGATRARDRAGSYAFWILIAVLGVAYVANLFGPPPPSVGPVVITGLAGAAAILALTLWVDRHRAPRSWSAAWRDAPGRSAKGG